MSESFSLPVRTGNITEPSFRIAPVNRAILNADADWPLSHELCLDLKAATALILPFFEQVSGKPLLLHDEINTVSFQAARRLSRNLKITAAMLKDDYDNPALDDLKNEVTLGMLLPEEEAAKAAKLSPDEISDLRRRHFHVICRFYNDTADKLNHLMEDFSKKGCQRFAVTIDDLPFSDEADA